MIPDIHPGTLELSNGCSNCNCQFGQIISWYKEACLICAACKHIIRQWEIIK